MYYEQLTGNALLVTRRLSFKAISITKAPLRKGLELPNAIKLTPAHIGPPMRRAKAEDEFATPSICPCCSAAVSCDIKLFSIGELTLIPPANSVIPANNKGRVFENPISSNHKFNADIPKTSNFTSPKRFLKNPMNPP